VQDLPSLQGGGAAVCPTCDHWLERTSGRSITAALACALATVLLLFPANLLPLMSVSALGMSRQSYISSGVLALWNAQWVIVALMVTVFAITLPFVRFTMLAVVLASVRLNRRPSWLGRAFRWTIHLDVWSMPDVFLIGCAVGYSRVSANLSVTIDWGGRCLIAAALLSMLSRATLDRRTVWRAIAPEQPLPSGQSSTHVISCTTCDLVVPAEAQDEGCPRCGARVSVRRRYATSITLALIIAGFALYLPANIYPMSSDTQLGQLVPHRIVDGIMELYRAGLWPLGILIFCTSIAIPLLKLGGLGWFLLSVRRRSQHRLVLKTRLYRLIDEVGRWSNVDVFTISVFVPLLQFGALASARADTGATAFILVVVLTMIASRLFDPRLMWDAALGPHG